MLPEIIKTVGKPTVDFLNQNPNFINLLMSNLAKIGCKSFFTLDTMKTITSFRPEDFSQFFKEYRGTYGFEEQNLQDKTFVEQLEVAYEMSQNNNKGISI